MKIERKPQEFRPVTIVLETEEEYKAMKYALNLDEVRLGHTVYSKIFLDMQVELIRVGD